MIIYCFTNIVVTYFHQLRAMDTAFRPGGTAPLEVGIPNGRQTLVI